MEDWLDRLSRTCWAVERVTPKEMGALLKMSGTWPTVGI